MASALAISISCCLPTPSFSTGVVGASVRLRRPEHQATLHFFWLCIAFFGVLAFSFTVPFTRVAVEGLEPMFIGAARAVVAAVLAAAALVLTRQRLPRGSQWVRLAVVAGGVVAGFPLLTSYALAATPASVAAATVP